MDRRGFLAAGMLLPFGRRRPRRITPRTTTKTLPVIQFETRDKIANLNEILAKSPWYGKKNGKKVGVVQLFNGKPAIHTVPQGEGIQRSAEAFLPRNRAILFYQEGKPKIWWGQCLVVQYAYPSDSFISCGMVFYNSKSNIEDFPE